MASKRVDIPAGEAGGEWLSGTVTAVTSVQYAGTKTAEWAFQTTAYLTNFKGYPSVYSRTNQSAQPAISVK